MKGKRILIVDDEPDTAEMLKLMLRSSGAEITAVTSGETALEHFRAHAPDLIVLDVMMPDVDGLDVCRRIRRESHVPILLVSAFENRELIIAGLDAGADDYLIKPVDRLVLQARIRAIMRRSDPGFRQPTTYADGYLTVDLDQRRISIREKEVPLSPTEFRLLSHLLRNSGRVCVLREILVNVWGESYQDAPHYTHIYISKLRRKLEKEPENPEYILTEYRIGYRFVRKPTGLD